MCTKSMLRTYKQIVSGDITELYVKVNINACERSVLAQLRMGILPIRIEIGRLTNLKQSERICQI